MVKYSVLLGAGGHLSMQKNMICVCKSLVLSYLVMLLLMCIASFAIWKLDISENVLKGIVIVLYVLSAAIGGIYIGKKQKEKKFLWGLLTGSLYFLILVVLTLLSGDFSGRLGTHFATAFLICALSGTLGGMLA